MTQWQKKEQAPKEFGKQFPEFSNITLNLLWQRGLRDQKQIDEFFNPDYSSDIHDPFLMKNMKKAVARIFKALDRREKVMVYGDYDADGICGSTIIYNALKAVGFNDENLGIYLPDREKEGYGLNEGAVKAFIQQKYNLILTVDCGTTSYKEIDLARKNKIGTIVFDHHQVIDGNLPKAYAFVNPHQKGETYPFKHLCGAGVAFKLACALFAKARAVPGTARLYQVQHGQEKWFLDLAAIATITDVVPLIGENRTIVKYGLFVIAKTQRKGLKALMDISRISPVVDENSLSTNINPFTIGFVLGPRLNAAGRMDHASIAFYLLNSVSEKKAFFLAKQINDKNKERQDLVNKIVKEAEERISTGGVPGTPPAVIFEGDKFWPLGVAGIVAGRLSEKYYKPAFAYQIKSNGTAAGSARAIPGFNVIKALESAEDLLINFGGHPQAGGFTIAQENLDKMKEKIERFAKDNLKKKDYVKTVEYCAEVFSEEILWKSYEDVVKFEPFGEANREPVFFLRGVSVVNVEKVGNGNGHLRFFINLDGTKFKAMGFRMGDKFAEIKTGDNIDVLFSFAIDEWNGNRELMLRLVDFKVLAQEVAAGGRLAVKPYPAPIRKINKIYSKNKAEGDHAHQ